MTPQLAHLESARTDADRTPDAPFPYASTDTGFALAQYPARGVLRPAEPTAAVGAAGSTACPACDGETINGAGLFVCTSCDWTGILR
ncbi:hypothetical protein D8Y22_05295 [Salinadaptatus halalkaliphilus]|uniref:Uncharacterized protein n=1 Tax=Salinadaptatus halalkaliphilus TaxID=2419781 RepID=A0A4V3VLK8_9EURY|nr:hypothetical protein [Salinadaptatus halalkaliphilus]THE65937.1 hypothetical protein D8Y22_05295 [Salinadaptatus halalkaliphilus]